MPFASRPLRLQAFSLIEAAIVLGVIGLVIGGIWAAQASVTRNRETTQLLTDLLTTSQNIKRLFKNMPNLPDNTSITLMAYQAGAVPGNWIYNASSTRLEVPGLNSSIGMWTYQSRFSISMVTRDKSFCLKAGRMFTQLPLANSYGIEVFNPVGGNAGANAYYRALGQFPASDASLNSLCNTYVEVSFALD